MQIVHGFDALKAHRGGVVSIGNFDGVHRGHQAMLQELVGMARELQVSSVAMTFDPPPVALIAPQRVPPRLSTLARKAELMEQLGVDCLLVYPTDREFLSLTAEQFFDQIVLGELQAKGLVEGENFCFGKNRAGNSHLLRSFCQKRGLQLQIIPPVQLGHETISSTRIRELIIEGELEMASEWLGQAYRMTGTVVPGAQRGRVLGFPTANLAHVETLVPPAGVYAGFCPLEDRLIPAAVHVGNNPTFAEADHKIEVHLIDFEQNLYGQALSVDLFARCRSTQQFETAEALQIQLQHDIQQVRQLFEFRFGRLR